MNDENELDYLINAVEEGEAKPKERAKSPDVPVKSFDVDPNAKVWVKCVTENRPWTESEQLDYWKDYEIPLDLALIFESRKHAVILQAPNSKGTN